MSEIFTAVTPDGKETEIGKVKVSMTQDVSEADLAIIRQYIPNFQPKSEMLRLEIIDEEIVKLQETVAKAQADLDEKISLRARVAVEAGKVALTP